MDGMDRGKKKRKVGKWRKCSGASPFPPRGDARRRGHVLRAVLFHSRGAVASLVEWAARGTYPYPGWPWPSPPEHAAKGSNGPRRAAEAHADAEDLRDSRTATRFGQYSRIATSYNSSQ